MHFASALSDQLDTEAALEEVLTQVTDELGASEPDLIVVFFSSHHRDKSQYTGERIHETFPWAAVFGCSAGGVLGARRELEGEPSLAILAARLPGVVVHPFYLEPDDIPKPDRPDRIAVWRQAIAGPELAALDSSPAAILILPDPFTVDVTAVITGVNEAFPGVPLVGGVASGARLAGQTRLLSGERRLDRGLVGVVLSGNVVVDTVVAQGCRPVGQPMFVTRAERNLIHELDGKPVLQVVQALYSELSKAEQGLFQQGLHLGLVMSEHQQSYERGDFLVRNVLGYAANADNALAVGAVIEPNTVVQFQLRDAATSAEDLMDHLRMYAGQRQEPPAGGLLFSCLGRGKHLYGRPNHDSSVFFASVGDVPLAGFFCNGEIGPVRGKTYLHGYTSAFALFRPASALS